MACLGTKHLAPELGLKSFDLARKFVYENKIDGAIRNATEVGRDGMIIWVDDDLKAWKENHDETMKKINNGIERNVCVISETLRKEKGIFNRPNTVLLSPCNGLTKHHLAFVDQILANPGLIRNKVVIEFEEGIRESQLVKLYRIQLMKQEKVKDRLLMYGRCAWAVALECWAGGVIGWVFGSVYVRWWCARLK